MISRTDVTQARLNYERFRKNGDTGWFDAWLCYLRKRNAYDVQIKQAYINEFLMKMKAKIKTHVLMVSTTFPKGHILEGMATGFVDNIKSGLKKTTIRDDYDTWNRKIEEIQSGEAVLSVRYWDGRPYGKGVAQIEIARLTKDDPIGIQRIDKGKSVDEWYVDGELTENLTKRILNEGFFFYDDFISWFGEGERKNMALIHFTELRY